ncbi:uncharacterized protein F4822DRAFT_431022 [Hypoxylon trugodes]|uniref:uncharacterized protein n=1 Tax=Hypoxylon trugodes TaxID=326681 RepID=UPI002196DC1D|nr:uncharacterized protein F4822DRAFT_431022 [Hypoxylon trugodes]KAI1386149.1 hypothetical protein F4822DRAFT_431022 [Hypoxylon trugodes]
MPPERIQRARRVVGVGPLNRSTRNVKGAEGSYGAVRGTDINENMTLAEFVRLIVSLQERGEYYPHKEGWTYDLFFRRKSLFEMLDEFREQRRAEQDDLVRDYFDGGETVIWKVYDEEGLERVFTIFTDGWEYHKTARHRGSSEFIVPLM